MQNTKVHAALVVILLTGCASVPKVTQVQIPTYIPVPAALTAECPVAMPTDTSEGELLRVARERRASLEDCSARMGAIRGIASSPVK